METKPEAADKTSLITALALVYVLWGSTFLGVKIGTEILPPFLLSGLRFLLAGSLMLAWGLWREKKPSLRECANAALVGVLLIGIGNATVALALSVMPSGMVAMLIATLPAWIIILDWLFFARRMPSALTFAGLLMGFAGLYYIFDPLSIFHAPPPEAKHVPLWPIPLLMLGCVAWAYGSLKSPRMQMPTPAVSSAIQMLAGMGSTFALSLCLEQGQGEALAAMNTRVWTAIIYLVTCGSLVGFTAYTWLVNNAPPQLTATYAYVNPVVAIFLGWLVLDERLSGHAMIGSAIVIAGVVLMTLKKK
ncbi:EamA family transporter [Chitinophaga lutea]